jgi:SAM-dependent methyltransferase
MHTNGLTHRLKWALDAAAVPVYRATGRPFSPGYETSKLRTIQSAIDNGVARGEENLPAGYGIAMDERVVEYPWLFARLRPTVGKMLDAGSTFNHDYLLRRPPLKGADLTIMTLAPEKRCYWYQGFSYVFGDLRQTMFADRTFDTIASISTIEHIGLDNTMLYTGNPADAEKDEGGFAPAVKEFKRVLKPGGSCFISFPFGKRANLGWYQVFDHAMVDKVVEIFSPQSHRIDYFGYYSDGWQRAAPEALKDATVYDVHTGGGWGKDRAASSRAIACLELIA